MPVEFVTVIWTVPAACAGDVIVSWVSLIIEMEVPAVASKETPVAVRKPVPVTVTTVPPAIVPEDGLILVTVGTSSKVNSSPADVVDVPAALTTVMSIVPALCAGDIAVIELSEFTVKLAADVAPKFTAVALVKPVPVIATDVPPAVVPARGVMVVTEGVPNVYLEAAEVLEVPAALATVISIVPAACAGDVAVIDESELIV